MNNLKVRVFAYIFSGFTLGNAAWFLLPEVYQNGTYQTWGEFILYVGVMTSVLCTGVTIAEWLYAKSKESDDGSDAG